MDGSEITLVYEDSEYALGQKDGLPCLIAGGRRFRLSCHPFEPCLYITDEDGKMTIVHNSFDPSVVLELVREGRTMSSITGRHYEARDFCRMVEYAAGKGEMGIDEAEKVFGTQKNSGAEKTKGMFPGEQKADAPEPDHNLIRNDPFFGLIRNYPDAVPEYCLLKAYTGGQEEHRKALKQACGRLMAGDEETDGWNYDLSKARIISELSVRELLSGEETAGRLSYRRAFLEPPYGCDYTEEDFGKVVAALFPGGTDSLEIFEWSTDWSDYFDDGHEWWGALCLSIYDRRLGRLCHHSRLRYRLNTATGPFTVYSICSSFSQLTMLQSAFR